MNDAAGTLGIAILLAWVALPLLALIAHRAREPEPRQRALTMALVSAALLLPVPWLRVWTHHATAICFSKQTITAALEFAPSQYLLQRAAAPSLWVIIGALAAISIAFAALRMLVATIRLRGLLARSRPAPEPIAARAAKLALDMGLKAPRVYVSTEAPVPFLAGWPSRTIVLPEPLLSILDEDGLDLVLIHELVHADRRDVELSWLVALARIPFLLHPVTRWLAREIALAREQAVDAIVARDDPRTYARVLIEVAAHSGGKICPAPVAMSCSSLERRIVLLTERANPASSALRRVGPVIAAAVVLVGAAMLAPLRAESTRHAELISCDDAVLPGLSPDPVECWEPEIEAQCADSCDVCVDCE